MRRFALGRWGTWGTRACRVLLGLVVPCASQAQFIGEYLPSAVPGYQQEPGVTVGSRLRPLYQPMGARIGDFVLHSDLLETTGYNSNVAGFGNSPGSWLLRTAPSLAINSDWSRNQIGAAFTADDAHFLSTLRQNYTDWTASLGGGYTIDRRDLVLGYSHLSLHEDPTQIGSALSSTPIPYQVEDLRSSYTFDRGRLSFEPRVDAQLYRYGDATLLGVPVGQQNENRVVLTAGLETRYALSDLRSLVFVVEGIDSSYVDEPSYQPTDSSKSVLALGGIDYQESSLWRYRLLVGIETRQFDAPQYASHTAPIIAASVVWTPTGMTTVTGTLSRTIEDPAAAGTGGYTYTLGRLVIDHEYLRNVLLEGHVGFENADFLQGGGTQRNVSFGAGVHWLLGRQVRLGLDYSFLAQSGSGVNANLNVAPAKSGAFVGLRSPSFDRNVALLSLRFSW